MVIQPSVGLLHLVSTLLMAGVILFVQVVHYPLMSRVGPGNFGSYESGHTFRTGLVVIPLMLSELASALWLAAFPPEAMHPAIPWVGLGLLAVIWVSTALLQAPAHGRLRKGFDDALHRKLVRTNWIRTVAWLGRVPLAVILLG
jgi:hypothetical protein